MFSRSLRKNTDPFLGPHMCESTEKVTLWTSGDLTLVGAVDTGTPPNVPMARLEEFTVWPDVLLGSWQASKLRVWFLPRQLMSTKQLPETWEGK